MRKLLLVLLVGLLSVASFATVDFSGLAFARLEVTMDATGNIALSIPWYGYFEAIATDSSTNTEFYISLGTGFEVYGANAGSTTEFYVQQYLYKTDPLSVRYKLGYLGGDQDYGFYWGTSYVNNYGEYLALLFDMTSGDLTDNLGVYAYFPTATSVDLDVVNSLSFLYFDIDVAAKGIVSAGAGSFPELGADVTVDLGEALSLPEGSSLDAFAYFGLDPAATDVTGMLAGYTVGASFGYDTVTGSFSFEGPDGDIGASFKTTALDPVTLYGKVKFPINLTGVSDLYLYGYLQWPYELLVNRVYAEYDGGDVTAGWRVMVFY